MFGFTTKKGGMVSTTGPSDMCKTPSGPILAPAPYSNLGTCDRADPGTCTSKVRIGGAAALTKSSKGQMSSGNEPGVGGGIASSRIKGPFAFMRFSAKVMFEGANAVYHLCDTVQNGFNAMGKHASPSQTKVKGS